MTVKHDRGASPCPRRVPRREFLKLAAAAGLLAGCRSAPQPTPTPTGEPASTPTPTLTPTHTPAPTLTPTHTPTPSPAPTLAPVPSEAVRRPEIIQFHPDAPSKVVQARHTGAWTGTPQGGTGDNDLLVPEVLRQMLYASITELTGLDDARDAWAALFAPDERTAIKVNTIEGSAVWTHVPLVMAVTECLEEAGVPAEQIVVFDRANSELRNAGYSIKRDGPGTRCYGTGDTPDEGDYVAGWELVGSSIQLSDILLQCDALINVPILKSHSMAGLSFAMKNHYGTFDRPWDFHRGQAIRRGVAELNALPPIKDRTRLIIGDVLAASTVPRSTRPYWTLDAVGDSILMSFDPVAHDTVGLQVFTEMGSSHSRAANSNAKLWLRNGAELGLGTDDPENIDLVEINLG
jgi:hypothetical protein